MDLKKYFRDLWIVAAGMAAAMATDFIFYLLAGRLLGPREFGIFGTVMALYYVVVRSPFKSLEMTSKKIEAEGNDAVSRLGKKSLYAGVTAWIIFLLLSPAVSSLLSVPLETLWVFSLVFPFAYALPVFLGRLHGHQRFKEYALYEVLGSLAAFSAISLVVYGWGSTGAIAAPVLEIASGFFIVLLLLRPDLGSGSFKDRKLFLRSIVEVSAVSAAFSIDIMLLQFFKPSSTVGLYSAVSVFGKGIFFSAVALNRSVFPKFVTREDSRRKMLDLSLGLIAVGAVAAYSLFKFFGGAILGATFGPAYTAAAVFAPLYMLFISAVSAVALMGNYYLSFDRERLWLILMMPVLQSIGIVLFHSTVLEVVKVSLLSSLLTLIVLYLPVLKNGQV